MHKDILIGARDPHGWRPLVIGKIKDSYVLASETCAFDLIGADYIREVNPGEIVFISGGQIKSYQLSTAEETPAACIFEHIYFARPDSKVFGRSVYQSRKDLGRALARQASVDADIVIPVPDSGNYAALGYAEESGMPLEMGIVRNHYIGRTFIQPSQFIRDFKVKVKLNPVKDILRGQRVVVIEDSIVRGTTTKMRIRSLREAGAREIHMRVSCPPLKYPCYYGIDFPTQKELIAFSKTIPEICRYLELDSLQYLSYQQMLSAVGGDSGHFCTACFNGDYCCGVDAGMSKDVFEK
jgi:amidophosphoribosyltransferase